MFDLTNLFHSFYINFLQALGLQSDEGGPTNYGSIQTSQSLQMPSGSGRSINMPSPNNMGNNIQPNVSFLNHNLLILFL